MPEPGHYVISELPAPESWFKTKSGYSGYKELCRRQQQRWHSESKRKVIYEEILKNKGVGDIKRE